MKKMYSKKYREATNDIDLGSFYGLEEAISLIKKTSVTKFDATTEAHFRLGVDIAAPEQMVRGIIDLPHGSGKTRKILVFAKDEKAKEAKEAGADMIGAEDWVEKIEKGFTGFDVVVAAPEMMPTIARLGKILGTKGLMPSPKSGTVTQDIGKTVKALKAGRVEFRMDAGGVVHLPFGKASFTGEALSENFVAALKAIIKAKPSGSKGAYLKSVSLSTTMGPGIKVDLSSLKI